MERAERGERRKGKVGEKQRKEGIWWEEGEKNENRDKEDEGEKEVAA